MRITHEHGCTYRELVLAMAVLTVAPLAMAVLTMAVGTMAVLTKTASWCQATIVQESKTGTNARSKARLLLMPQAMDGSN